MTLVLARHGETPYNAEHRLVGRADPPLRALGRRQAGAIGTALAGATSVVASPLRRAQQTAAALGVPVPTDAVVVTHVGPIKAAVVWAVGVGDAAAWRMFCDVASITRVDVGERGPVLRSFNDTRHLAALEAAREVD